MSERIEARVEHRFQASPERVYDAWLDPAGVRVWMKASLQSFGLPGEIVRIEIDPRVGGKFFFSDLRNGAEARHWGTYLELDRPRKIVFTWIVDASEESNPSKVTLSIVPDGAGSKATIVHEMDPQWKEYVARTEAGWGRMLRHVELLLSGELAGGG